MSCSKVGSGQFAANSACKASDLAATAKMIDPNAMIKYENGEPYASTNLNFEHKMPLGFLSTLFAGSKALTASKVEAAQAGQVFEAPKTVAGKLIGRLTGRTQAAEISTAMQSAKSDAPVGTAVANNLSRQGFPVGGAVQFGSATNQTALPFNVLALIAGTFVAIFYFFSKNKKGGRRRRY